MMDAGVTQMFRNLGYIVIALANELFCFFDLCRNPKINGASSHRFFEYTTQIGSADGEMITKRCKRGRMTQVVLHIQQNGIHQRAFSQLTGVFCAFQGGDR